MVAAAAFAGPASADLVAGPSDPATGIPSFLTDLSTPAQAGFLCLGPDAPCGAGTATDIRQDGAEAFYWTGAATIPVAAGEINISFDVEASTAAGVTTTFQRVQMGSADTPALPAGDYTFTTPFGVYRATRDVQKPRNWLRVESASAAVGPIDHFLTSTTAPAGFYGNLDANPGPVVGGAAAGAVTVEMPGGTVALGTDWVIGGRRTAAAAVPPPPPADGDGDGVPNNVDGCPSTPGLAANNGCPAAPAGAGTPTLGQPAAPAPPQVVTTTIVEPLAVPGAGAGAGAGVAARPLHVIRLTLARRIDAPRLRERGLRASMRLQEGTAVVRIAIYRARSGQRIGRALFTTTRAPLATGPYRAVIRDRGLLRRLRAGRYVIEVRAGRSAATLGPANRVPFQVTG